jgi:predicted porin
MTRRLAPGVLAALAVIGLAGQARAAITLYDKDDWTLSIGGRAQGFYSFAAGDAVPVGDPAFLTGEGPIGAIPDDQGKFVTSRLRGGWAASMFGLTVTNQITPRLKVTGRLSFWFTVEGDQTKGNNNDDGSLDIRQGFVKLEGPWGGLLLGRNVGLHSRGSLMQDSFISADEYSVGSPCNITGLGITCGQVGYGVLMPGFNAGIVYNTPDLHGFVLSLGIYDPRRIDAPAMGAPAYGRTPVPRFETEALQHLAVSRLTIDLFANGMWQQARRTGPDNGSGTPASVDAYGVGYGLRVGIAGLQLGFVGGWDRGGGMYVPLGDVSIDATGHLRDVFTYWGQALYSIGKVDLTGGVGTAIMHSTAADDMDPMSSLVKSHVGTNGAVMYHLGPVVLVAQYFRMRHEWHRGQHQTANVFNTGATFNW